MSTILITDHAYERLSERSGLNKSAAENQANKAFEIGLKHNEMKGNLFKWVLSTTQTSQKGSMYRVYGDKLYIFRKDDREDVDAVLITVMQVPSNLTNLVLACKKNKGRKGVKRGN